VVFVGNGRPKQGHNAVAEHLIHRAFEAVHGAHHALQGRLQELLRGFRIEATDEFSGVFEVGEEHGHLLAFAFQGGAGGQDFVGEMRRCVGQRRRIRHAGLPQGYVSGGGRRSHGTAGPDQHGVVLVHRDLVHLDEFEFDILDVRLVQVELAFQRPI